MALLLVAIPGVKFIAQPALFAKASAPAAPLHVVSLPYYSIKGDWDSLLTLNNASHDTLTASPTLYSLDGTALQLPDVALQASGVAALRLREMVAQSIGGAGQFQEGSVELRFHNEDGMALAPQLTVADPHRGLSFDMEPAMGLQSSTLESLWWSLDEKTSARVMLSNTTAENLDAQISIEWRGVIIPVQVVSLSAHQTTGLEIAELLKRLNISAKGIESGGISITHGGAPGALIAQGVVENPARRFASNLIFIDPAAQKTSVFDGTGLLLGHPAVGSAVDPTAFYTPQLALKNTSKTTQTARVTVRYTGNGRQDSKTLPAVSLAPREVRMVDFKKFVAGLRNFSIKSAGLEVASSGEPGSIITLLTSVDEAGSRAVDVPMVSRSERSGEGGNHPFRLDEGVQSVAYLTNIASKPTKVVYAIFYEGGVYMPELVSLAAGETVAIDLLKLRDDQIKDVRGNTLPAGLSKGQVFWHPHQGEALIGRVVAIDKGAGTASTFGCPYCCVFEPSDWDSSPDPFGGPVGGQQQMTLYEYDSMCGQFRMGPYQATGVYNVYSDNTSVATVNSSNGMVSFVSSGYANIVWEIEYWHSDYISAEDCGSSPIFTSVPCPIAAVTVVFKKDDGSALPNPLQVGITATTLDNMIHDRTQQLQVVVEPADQANNVVIVPDDFSKLTVTRGQVANGVIHFSVVGKVKSTSRGDRQIKALMSGSGLTLATAPVSVVVPDKIATPHDTTGGGPVIENRALNVTTSPALIDVPSSQFSLVTVYMRNLTITVKDQFDDLIGDIYADAEISERIGGSGSVVKINQALTTSSTYTDPVGFSEPSGNIVPANDPRVTSWPSQPKIALRSGTNTDPQMFSVFVDGFRLNPDPAINNRTVTVVGDGHSVSSPPVSVTITWP